MKLTDKILLKRIKQAGELTNTEQAQLAADSEAQTLLSENTAFGHVKWRGGQEAPSRSAMLARVFKASAGLKEDKKMSSLLSLFSGKSLTTRIALACGIVLLLALAILFVPIGGKSPVTPAWASMDGYVLKFPDTEESRASGATSTKHADEFERALGEWRKGYERTNGPLPENFAHTIETTKDQHETALSLLNATEEQMRSVEDYFEELPEFPLPKAEARTWFYDDETMPSTTNGFEFSINGRTFSFPHGTTENEVEKKVNAWLKEADPENNLIVDVSVDNLENGTSVSVDVKSRGGGRTSVSASSSSSSSSSNSSSSRSSSGSSHSSSGKSSSSSSGGGGGGGGGSAGGGGNSGGGKGKSGASGGGGGSGSSGGGGGNGNSGGGGNAGGGGNSGGGSGGGSGSSGGGGSSNSGSGSNSGSSHSSNSSGNNSSHSSQSNGSSNSSRSSR